MKFFDTHAHYTDARFESEYTGGSAALLPDVFASGISLIVNVGTNPDNSRAAAGQAALYDGMYAAVGIHPTDCQTLNGSPEAELAKIRSMLDDRERLKIKAIGEIGFDYHYDDTDREKQAFYFEEQLKLAAEYGLPVIIHDRDAHGDCFDMILKHPEVRGVFHSFSGSRELAHELVRRGWYISFSGVVSFKNAARVREVAASIPDDRLMIETDCPYLAPEPHRGQLNHSGFLPCTLTALAAARGTDVETLSEKIFKNSCIFFDIDKKS